MLKKMTEIETLGAEALPGGLAEILRTLQPEFEPTLSKPRIPVKRGIRAFFAWRRKQSDVVA